VAVNVLNLRKNCSYYMRHTIWPRFNILLINILKLTRMSRMQWKWL